MNPVAVHLASGDALFSGALLLLVAGVASLWPATGVARRVAALLAVIGATFQVLSSTPFPWLAHGVLVVVTGLFVALLARDGDDARRRHLDTARYALAILAIAGPVAEAWDRRPVALEPRSHTRMYVVGDSISSGLGGDPVIWPDLFRREGLVVTNLARAGVGVADVLPDVARIEPGPALVVLEIGGNDLLGGRSPAVFRRDLATLVERVAAPGRTLVMVELPLLPGFKGYGRAQRDIARAHGIRLVPKREFLRVLAAEAATQDGLHLSPEGHAMMAELIGRATADLVPPPTRGS